MTGGHNELSFYAPLCQLDLESLTELASSLTGYGDSLPRRSGVEGGSNDIEKQSIGDFFMVIIVVINVFEYSIGCN